MADEEVKLPELRQLLLVYVVVGGDDQIGNTHQGARPFVVARDPSDLAIENFLGGLAVGRQGRYVTVKNLVRFVDIEGCEARLDPDGVVDVLALLQLYLVVGERGERANRHNRR